MTDTAALFNAANAAPAPVFQSGTNATPGAISGGLLRPGAIDQKAFLLMLRAQEANRAAAGVGGRPVDMPVPAFQAGIPTLSSAQFAALVGDQTPEAGDDAGLAADPRTQASQTAASQTAESQTAESQAAAAPVLPRSAPQQLSGIPRGKADVGATIATTAGATIGLAVPAETDDDAPRIFRGSPVPASPVPASPVPASPAQASPAQASPAQASPAPAPGVQAPGVQAASASDAAPDSPAAATSETAPSDPKVVHFQHPPDKDTQRDLRLQGKRWVLDETPGSRQLFFGPDGQFGWDDFLDVINPLQHIPIVAQIYRAVTGDQIYGAADLIGAIPFTPLGGLGLASAIIDLAVKDATGKDIGANVTAMLFGPGNSASGTENMASTSQGAVNVAERRVGRDSGDA